MLIEVAAPILRQVTHERGFANLAVYGSVARRSARLDSDIDLLVEAPRGSSVTDLLDMRELLEHILGRAVDLATYGGLRPVIDDDVRREAMAL